MTTATQVKPVTDVRILKTATCPSASGRSTLTYQLGCTPASDVVIRMWGNTRAGFFSKEWVSFAAIQRALSGKHEKSLTSFALIALFKGKSVNTPAFLFAALRNEGLVKPLKDTPRRCERTDHTNFVAGVKALMAAPVDAKVTPTKMPVKPKASAPAKKAPSKSSKSAKKR